MKPSRVEIDYRLAARPEWIDEQVIAGAVEIVLADSDWEGAALSILFVDEKMIAAIHEEFLGDPSVTDVITFDLRDVSDGRELECHREGEIGAELLICAPLAKGQADERGHAPMLEILLYIVHGLLHLLGEDDGDDEARSRMRARERELFVRLNLAYPF